MKRWLLNLLGLTPAPQPMPAAPEILLPSPVEEDAPEWTAEDAATLLAYLRADNGRLLLRVMRHQEELLKRQACDDTEKRVDHARGQAVGYRKAIASLIVLSAPPPPKEETADTPDSGADELRDQLSHT